MCGLGGHAVAAGSHREFAMASGEMSEGRVPLLPGRYAGRCGALLARTAPSTSSAWTGVTWTASRLSAARSMANPEPMHLEQVECRDGITLPLQA